MPTSATVSVIIPTYNRVDLLRETLDSLAQQSYPCDRFEVIVVDDGSVDGTPAIATETFPFVLRYFWQSNQGDAAARNLGARQSGADILVFVDDDILVEAGYLAHLVQAHDVGQHKIAAGSIHPWPAEETPFSQSLGASTALPGEHTVTSLPFTEVYSNNMSLRREAYFQIGLMQGLDFRGSSMWCDLDFNYRAYRQGFEFCLSPEAICWHRDFAVRSLDTYKLRMKAASFRAVALFKKYPELLPYVPMFHDKTPIAWGQDSPRLVARKWARVVASSGLALWSMEYVVRLLEKGYPTSGLLAALYRHIVGGYIFQGYRQGLKEFGQIDSVGDPIGVL